ncbi:APC family permease [Candidatus Solirubrobacter pratensis]|uniref:APC family permease n=1 Tax=Candidatus Solirubrobacter pratensis TaxID=1298857 RepID=UPI000407BE49|nr:amino acid permease [Candidatus Solirubrobacter pratensis]
MLFLVATARLTGVPAQLQRTLGLGGGIALAIGSVAGSGILFLPSTIYALAGHDALVVWGLATLLCVPLLLVFGEMVRESHDGAGIEGFIARGLGPEVAACVPLLFALLFPPALAAATLVAGGYLQAAVGGGTPVRLAGALAVIAGALQTNLVGAKTGARLQSIATFTLLAAAVLLVALTFPQARPGYDAVLPRLHSLDPLLGGVLVAFWGFAGFENMTFVAGEMRNPRRDYLIAAFVALAAYGLLAALLTANIGAIIPPGQVDELSGVAQLAHHVAVPAAGVAVITVLALALMQANNASWLWGISRLLFASAREGRAPAWLAKLDARGIPRRAVLVLQVPGAAITCGAAFVPGLVLHLVVGVSAVFMFIYALALASYVRTPRPLGRRLGAGVMLALMAGILAGQGWYALPPVIVAALASGAGWTARRRARDAQSPPLRKTNHQSANSPAQPATIAANSSTASAVTPGP